MVSHMATESFNLSQSSLVGVRIKYCECRVVLLCDIYVWATVGDKNVLLNASMVCGVVAGQGFSQNYTIAFQ